MGGYSREEFATCLKLGAVMFWSTCSFLSFCTSIALFFYVNGSNSVEMFGYSHKIAAAILGFINSGFFLINAVKSYKSCKSSWSYLLEIAASFVAMIFQLSYSFKSKFHYKYAMRSNEIYCMSFGTRLLSPLIA
ncbi:MARVEL domain-containing protein [Nephila pilipes]|uniref:MARVEL domain-containing protein n=1 Tax=Nephila pilipes TaxID=299642 RepID=A0A8X6UTG7_NEPPI|nr:MARVEL domain-containing protein [Nephila pilipes]